MIQNYTIYLEKNKIIIGNIMNIDDGISKMTSGIRQQDIYYLLEEVIKTKENIQISNLENQNVFELFFAELPLIKAAGGVVVNNKEEILMIFRNNIWDLPKGKLEEEENIEDCALREVMEETGIENLKLEKFLKHTYHIYKINNRYVLKQTHWYKMFANTQILKPQLEEGITEAKWIAKNQIADVFTNTFGNIIDVLKIVE